jgi:hypothetical protein
MGTMMVMVSKREMLNRLGCGLRIDVVVAVKLVKRFGPFRVVELLGRIWGSRHLSSMHVVLIVSCYTLRRSYRKRIRDQGPRAGLRVATGPLGYLHHSHLNPPFNPPPFLSHPLLRPIRAKPVRLLETRRVPTLPRHHLNDNPRRGQ